jgi:Tol biopolymer transport system component
MKADGTEPRRLTWGKWPHWSKDSKRVFYKDLLQGELKSIDIDGGATEPTPVFSCQNLEPRVSPDNKYIAYVEKNTLKILDFSSQELIASWTGPSGMWRGSWAPNNRLFSVVKQIQAYRVGTGLWIYDLNKKKTEKVLGPPSLIIGWVCWSPDEHQLAFALGRFVDEIWVIETEKLGPAQTAEENCQEMADLFRRMAKASPQNPEMYLFHAACYLESAERMKRSAIHTEHADLALGALTNLGPRVNSQSNDCMPSISSDGLELYFASDRPGGSGGYDLWVAKRESINDNWFTPVNLGMVVNSGNYDIWPSISAGGLTLYFCSSRPGGYGGEDIWVTTRASRDDNWSAPVNLSPAINSSSRDRAPVISADGLELFFASTRYGNYDLWVARRGTKDSDWSAPVNLGPGINSLHIESGPALSADGLWLFFHSNWPGGSGSNSDIYVMRRETKKDDWYQPGNLGPGINTAYAEVCPTVSADGRSLFFSDSRWSVPRPGGFGGADLWQVPIGSMPTTSELGRDVDLDEKSVKTDDKKEAVPVKNK